MASPPQQRMDDLGGVDAKGEGTIIASTMANKYAFQIVGQIEYDGCCLGIQTCALCNSKMVKRRYRVVGENFVEENTPCALLVCCCTYDCISKTYLDRPPFLTCCDKCCSDGTGAYVT